MLVLPINRCGYNIEAMMLYKANKGHFILKETALKSLFQSLKVSNRNCYANAKSNNSCDWTAVDTPLLLKLSFVMAPDAVLAKGAGFGLEQSFQMGLLHLPLPPQHQSVLIAPSPQRQGREQ